MVILVESLLFMGAGAGAGEKPETVKKTRSRSKTDRLRVTDVPDLCPG